VYDVGADEGWVSVGDDHDTAAFAVNAVRDWWLTMGRARYPLAAKLLVMADSGGSNSARSRVWKTEVARLATETGLEITVCHHPPGTSKWKKVEHRLFSFMTVGTVAPEWATCREFGASQCSLYSRGAGRKISSLRPRPRAPRSPVDILPLVDRHDGDSFVRHDVENPVTAT